MEINIEKFICDCIEKAERSVTWEYIDENIDGHIFKGALREQGLEYKNGKIVKIGEEPKEAEKDLELTWEDVREICTQSVLVEIDLGGLVSDERHYTEVLKRFKAKKGGNK